MSTEVKDTFDSFVKAPVWFPAFQAALPRMDGKIVAVTGCTQGIGWVCAKACAEQGARVIMVNRKSERSEQAVQELQRLVPYPRATLVTCDLLSFASVRAAAEQLRSELADTGLDVLCNNAGIAATKDEATEDGCDTQAQANHLSHFLLTAELWPLLEKAAGLHGEARVVHQTSGLRKGPLERKYFEKKGGDLGGDEGRFPRYNQSKLANVAFTYALRDRTARAGSKVKCLVADPGTSKTSMGLSVVADGGAPLEWGKALWQMSQHVEDGAMGLLRCCVDDDVQSGGLYGPNGSVGPANLQGEEAAADEAARDLLWQVSEEVTGASFRL